MTISVRATLLSLLVCGLAAGPIAARAQAPAATVPDNDGVHLGVASCSGSTCHGAVQPLKGSVVAQDEYIIWSRKDKHSKAYQVLGDELGERIARNLGLGDARTAEICLNCHADNVPANRRGPQFQISDGVGCEACHGGAKSWLGTHISGATHAQNIAAGMYPTDQPIARADKCLSCHWGDNQKFVTHEIMGAGHPRLGFELDTYTAAEPAHFVVDKDYVERKGPVNDVRIWAVGQAVQLVKVMDSVIDPKHAPHGVFPELVLFDCTACHHSMAELRWQKRPSAQLPPGLPPLDDTNAIMLKVIAARVQPDSARLIGQRVLALHKASLEGWPQVQTAARALRQVASDLVPKLNQHDFTPADMRALADGVIAAGLSHDASDYPGAAQSTMALGSIVAALRTSGTANPQQVKAMDGALNGLYESVAKDDTYKPDAFIAALRDFQKTLAMR